MSLKALHIVFVVASTLLAFGVGAWCLNRYFSGGTTEDAIYGVASVAVGVGLIAYGRYVLKKLKDISYL